VAVLIEGISVVVRYDAIDRRFPGGRRKFLEAVPNRTLCADHDLARVGFMVPADAGTFCRMLEEGGLTFVRDGRAVDFAVVEQMSGPTTPVKWLDFAHVPFDESGGEVAVCWLYEGPRMAVGLHMPSMLMQIATPDGWSYERSLSAKHLYVANEDLAERFELVRHGEDGIDVYRDRATGEEVYMGRTHSRHDEPEESPAGSAVETEAAETREHARVLETAATFLDLTSEQLGRLRDALAAAGTSQKLSGWAKRRYDEAHAIYVQRIRPVEAHGDERESETDGSGASLVERLQKLGDRLKRPLQKRLRRSPSITIPGVSLDDTVTPDAQESGDELPEPEPADGAQRQDARQSPEPSNHGRSVAIPEESPGKDVALDDVDSPAEKTAPEPDYVAAWREAKQSATRTGPYEPLLGSAAPEIYRLNAFRVTQLSVNASQSEVRREVDRISMAEKIGVAVEALDRLMPLSSAPDSDALRRAVERLGDPDERLVDEFFWFWPLDDGDGQDAALTALSVKGAAAASRLWESTVREGGRSGAIAIHNLAVAAHVVVLDAELDERDGKLGERRPRALASQWSTAFQRWSELSDNEAFWGVVLERAAGADDPRLVREDVVDIHRHLPEALATVSARLAVGDFDAGRKDACKRVFAQLQKSGLPRSAVDRAVREALAPARARLRASCDSVEKKSKGAPREILVEAGRLLEQTEPLLLLVDVALPEGDATREGLHDDLALTVMGMTIAYANESEDFRGSMAWLERAAKIAEGEAALDRIVGNMDKAHEMVALKAAADIGQKVHAALEPLRGRLKASGGSACGKRNVAARELLVAAGRLLEETEPLLLVIDGALPEGDARRTQMHDTVAGNVLNMTIGYINESEDLAGALPWLERAGKIAEGKEVKDRVKESIRTAKEMTKAKADHERAVRSMAAAHARREAQAARAARPASDGATTIELEILDDSLSLSIDDELVTTDAVRLHDVVTFERVGRRKRTIRVVRPQDRAAHAEERLYHANRGQKPGALQLKPIRV